MFSQEDFDDVREMWWAIYQVLTPVIPDLSPITDEQAAPFGLKECGLLPAELTDFTVSTVDAYMKLVMCLNGKFGRFAVQRSPRLNNIL